MPHRGVLSHQWATGFPKRFDLRFDLCGQADAVRLCFVRIGHPPRSVAQNYGYLAERLLSWHSTTIDTQQSEAIFGEVMHFCRAGENGKLLVMQVLPAGGSEERIASLVLSHRMARHLVHRPRRKPFSMAYVYFEPEPGKRAAANLMTKDEARKIAAGIAKLPELLNASRK